MKNLVGILLALFLFSITSFGQSPPPKKEPFKLFDSSDIIYWGGSFLDISSSIGKKELIPFSQSYKGEFHLGKNLILTGGVWTSLKFLEYHYDSPKEQKLIKWFKISEGVIRGIIAIRNSSVNKIDRINNRK